MSRARARASASTARTSSRRARRGRAAMRSSTSVDHCRNPGERNLTGEERGDRDLVGRVEHRRRRAARLGRLARQPGGGKARLVGRAEGQLADRGEVERRARRVHPPRPGEARGDRHAHVARARAAPASSRRGTRPSNGSRSAGGPRSAACSSPTGNRWCASISSRPLFIIVAESTLILAPMSQLGCATACAGVAACELLVRPVAERPAAGGQGDRAHIGEIVAGEALEDRVVLVNRPAAASRRGARPRRSSRRRPRPAPPCWRARSVPPCSIAAIVGREPRAADDRRDGQVGAARRGLDQRRGAARGVDAAARQRLAQVGQAALVGDHRDLGAEFARQRGQFVGLAIGGQRDDPPVVAVAADQVERRSARPNRSRRGWRSMRVSRRSTHAISADRDGAPASSPSTRSNTPPWPGISCEESFTPARRLSQLSKKSPACASDRQRRADQRRDARCRAGRAASRVRSAGRPAAVRRSPPATAISHSAAPAMPPNSPAQVFDGLIDGAILGPPIARPAK